MATQTSVDMPPSRDNRKRSSGMMGSSFRILKVRGISIGAHWSWLLVFGLVSYSLANDLFPSSYPDLAEGTYLVMGLAAAVIFFASIVLHELGHAFQALKEGMKIGDITLWLFGGVARFEGMFPSAGAEFRVAIAGPAVSLVLAIAFALVDWAGGAIGLPEPVLGVASYLARINGAVLLFNLVPALPLDGGRVLRSWLWQRQRSFVAATLSAAKAGKAFAYILMTIGIMGFFSNAVDGGPWMVFLGFFILQAAQSEVQYALVSKAFAPYTVRALMTVNPVVVSPAMTLTEFVEMAARIGHSTYPVTEGDGRLAGLISMRRVNQLPLEGRSEMPVRNAMLPAAEVVVLRPETPMMEALTALQEAPHRAVVLDRGQVVGFISISDVARSLQLEQARGALAPEPDARRSGTLVWVVVAVLMALAAGTFYRPPLAVISPAPAEDITKDITIKGIDAQKPNGKYLLLAVSLSQTNALGTLLAMLDPNSDVIPVSAIVPEGISARDYDRQQTDIFKESRLLAAAAAAEAAGLDATLKGTGARVIDVVDGSPAGKVLKRGDVIVAVDGKPVALATDLPRIDQHPLAGHHLRPHRRQGRQARGPRSLQRPPAGAGHAARNRGFDRNPGLRCRSAV